MRAANNLLGQEFYDWEILTMSGDAAASSSELSILPDGSFESMRPSQRLFLISSYGFDEIYNQDLRRVFQQHKYNRTEIFGLDTGAWLMAEAGLLHNKRATIHWDVLSRFEETFLQIDVQNRPFVLDGLMTTCGGAMATFDLMLHMIFQDCGAQVRFDVESLFKRPLSSRIEPVSDMMSDLAVTQKAVAMMRDNLETPLKVSALAKKLGLHPKTLERACKRELGMPAGQIYKRLRLGSVRDLVENTNANFSDIAVRCGYKSASAMTRAFSAEFGYTPSKLRALN